MPCKIQFIYTSTILQAVVQYSQESDYFFIFFLNLSLDKADHSLLRPLDTPSKNMKKKKKKGKKTDKSNNEDRLKFQGLSLRSIIDRVGVASVASGIRRRE